jgi:uncharacterized tellurite resistance protein B-like protein
MIVMKSLRSWLGLDGVNLDLDGPDTQEFAPLRKTLDALDHLEPDRARFLAAFAYLLGRIAHADRHVSAKEVVAMETAVREEGQLSSDQTMVVVQLAKTSNLVFGSTADFIVTREFGALASYEQKLTLLRCLFAVSATDDAISVSEEGEIHRIATALRIQPEDLVTQRVAHRRHLPGLSST